MIRLATNENNWWPWKDLMQKTVYHQAETPVFAVHRFLKKFVGRWPLSLINKQWKKLVNVVSSCSCFLYQVFRVKNLKITLCLSIVPKSYCTISIVYPLRKLKVQENRDGRRKIIPRLKICQITNIISALGKYFLLVTEDSNTQCIKN